MSCFENQILEQDLFCLFTNKMQEDQEFADVVKMNLYTTDEFFDEIEDGKLNENAMIRIFNDCLKTDYEQTIRNFFPVVYDMVTQ